MHMDQKIFELGLSTETVSAYLLCTGLADSDAPLTHEAILSTWAGTPEELEQSLAELEKRNIIVWEKVAGDGGLYVIHAVDLWV